MAKKTKETPAETGEYAGIAGLAVDIPIGNLVLDETNARKNHVPDPILIANIGAHGLLNRLIVTKLPDSDNYAVVDGGRRFVSIKEGVKKGSLSKDRFANIPCTLIQPQECQALELSMSANLHRAMHPLDVCEAIRELTKTGAEEQTIADHFGETVMWVKRSARLADLTEKAKDLYRKGGMEHSTAQLMTRLSDKDQNRLAKLKFVSMSDVREVISTTSVDSAIALFDWRNDYPKDKQQPSLFDDITMLLDVDLFRKMQEERVQKLLAEKKAEGYNVLLVPADDYNTVSRYVAFTGKPKKETIPSLTYIVKQRYNGLQYDIHENMIDRKAAEKIENKKGKADETAEEPKPSKCTDLNSAQQEILLGHGLRKVMDGIIDGSASEDIVKWVVLCAAFRMEDDWGSNGFSEQHQGPMKRLYGIAETYKEEGLEFPSLGDTVPLTWAKFKKLTPKAREVLYRLAVACLIHVPFGYDVKKADWRKDFMNEARPGAAFFKRYRNDQLIDYLKKSGVKLDPKTTERKRAQLVEMAVEASNGKKGFRFF
jgi:ParB-like chromosome segregation protein Spo0J